MQQHPHEAPQRNPSAFQSDNTPPRKSPGIFPVTHTSFPICGAHTTPGPTTLFRKGALELLFQIAQRHCLFMPVVQWDLNRGACVP
ncbi:hypothetical protein CEXT_678351 [Caerostris extrusa]|uniref:Uncharacterized protein n=1 Tax=Caerostris extrusa TaxID=172846 RepID=A0AAV4VQ01_CAEEX|nr:hypothetical protein CEXT_678351 [Caerostris extrusa]